MYRASLARAPTKRRSGRPRWLLQQVVSYSTGPAARSWRESLLAYDGRPVAHRPSSVHRNKLLRVRSLRGVLQWDRFSKLLVAANVVHAIHLKYPSGKISRRRAQLVS